jgi:serine/threonine protein kinase
MEPLEAGDPRQVGRYEIVARLGSGGMGRVYLARSASGEQFALKMIHQFLSDDVQFRRRFEREVMAARRVTGEHTAALVDADPDARPPWMAVEYVDGPTLTELIDQGGPLTLTSCLRLASGMALALISIHAVGLVHRDLKPSNVLMGTDGARLIDFGIAQASGASSLTMTGLVTGSAGFMSPEQAQAEHVTEASDVFALGTVLYFAATGRRPFGEGSIISVTYRVVHADPDLSEIRDDGLRDLIADCLMKDPLLRPTPEEIYARCPRIADGSWSVGRSRENTTALAAADLAPTGSQPLPRNAVHPATMSSRRDGRESWDGRDESTGLRRYLSRPWLIVPVAGILALAGGAAVVLTAFTGESNTPAESETTSTQAPVTVGVQPSAALPTGPNGKKPLIFESTTQPPRPRNSQLTRPTAVPTKTKSGVDPKPSPSASDPVPDEPTVAPTVPPTVPVTTPVETPASDEPTPTG